jgi:hypothetical protein
MTTTLYIAIEALQLRQPFISGNLTAQIEGREVDGEIVPLYVVRSYGVEIAKASPWVNDCEVLPSAYTHSVTTSKHANIVKSAWDIA